MPGVKHLIECHCYLAIYKKNRKLINHKFPVYSKIDNDEKLIPKLVKCNNCDALHYVTKICTSEIRPGKDQTAVTLSQDEIAMMLPQKIVNILRNYDSDISNWEHALDIIEERRWGEAIVLKRDIIDERQQVKIIEIHSESKIKLSTEIIDDIVLGNS
tara:strand:- start:1676 stop:2149 length:474 start_codon:yes stop_codon:yes gene_type:complete